MELDPVFFHNPDNSLKYARIEEERRFLLRSIPEELLEVEDNIRVIDRYITGTRLRLIIIRGNQFMSYRELKSYQDFNSIPIKDRWTNCTVGLEHSVSGDYYWLSCSVRFYVGEQSNLYIHIGGGSRSDAKLIFSTLEANGFKQTLRRVMREWEYFDYQRTPTRVTPKDST